ncbi:MAG: hypothetical protein U0R66_17695 [Mycobacterium sp.]
MRSAATVRRVAGAAGAAALVGMGLLSACGAKETPTEVPASSSPEPATPSPTEKVLTPGPHAGTNPQSPLDPNVKAPPAQTVLPEKTNAGG